MNMKANRSNWIALALLALGSTFTSHAFGAFSVTVTVDENGNGNLSNSNGFSSGLAAAMQADTGPGGLPSALTYDLLSPPGLIAGDLLLLEPGSASLSDIIRFNPSESTGVMVFYSDNADGVDALADTGFPTDQYANTLTLTEVGPEAGPNGITYTPTDGQPGFVTGAAGPVTYVIQSDTSSVPEPASLAVVGLGGFALSRAPSRLI